MIKIWEKYLLKECIKVLIFCLLLACSLFSIVDYSVNYQKFQSLSYFQVIQYYLYAVIVESHILLPVALGIATNRIFYNLVTHSEIVAFLVSGFRKIKLLRPFISISILLILILYGLSEFVLPSAIEKTNIIQKRLALSPLDQNVRGISLPNNTKILYQSYNNEAKVMKDVYWFISFDEIIHMQSFYPFAAAPFGEYVDSLKRDENGNLLLTDSFERKEFSEVMVSPKILEMEITDPESQPLTDLVEQTWHHKVASSDRYVKIKTTLYAKLLLPFGCIIAVLLPSTFFFQFSRRVPVFFIYSATFFGLLFFFTIMDAARIIAEAQVTPVLPTLLLPIVLFSLFFAYRFAKMR